VSCVNLVLLEEAVPLATSEDGKLVPARLVQETQRPTDQGHVMELLNLSVEDGIQGTQ
jgi:hypothetical protein